MLIECHVLAIMDYHHKLFKVNKQFNVFIVFKLVHSLSVCSIYVCPCLADRSVQWINEAWSQCYSCFLHGGLCDYTHHIKYKSPGLLGAPAALWVASAVQQQHSIMLLFSKHMRVHHNHKKIKKERIEDVGQQTPPCLWWEDSTLCVFVQITHRTKVKKSTQKRRL